MTGVKKIRARSGPFVEQHYYEDAASEDMAMAELSGVGLLPETPEPVRVDRFIEKRFGIVPEYKDLPAGVMGYTKFGPSEIEEVIISRALSEEGRRSAERLINSTLAHEAGHMIMHKGLFTLQVREGEHPLLASEIDLEKGELKCRSDIVKAEGEAENIPRHDGRWWEYQANQMIGTLLMPRPLVYEAIDPLLASQGLLGIKVLEDSRREDAARLLAETFDVNPAAARVRVAKLFPEMPEGQLTL